MQKDIWVLFPFKHPARGFSPHPENVLIIHVSTEDVRAMTPDFALSSGDNFRKYHKIKGAYNAKLLNNN